MTSGADTTSTYTQGAAGLDCVDVVVVGAGLTGLTAAYRLHRLGITVAVIEAKFEVGGAIQSEQKPDGTVLEWGPHTIQNTGQDIMALIDELGLTPLEADPACKKRFVFYRGQLREVPSSLGAFLTTPLLSVGAKIRLLAEPIIPGSCQTHDETVAQWVTRRLGLQVLTNLVAPFLSGVYAGDPNKMSAVSVLKTLARWEKRYSSITAGAINTVFRKKWGARQQPSVNKRPYALVNFKHGMQTLPKALAKALSPSQLYLNECLTSIETDGNIPLSQAQWLRVVTHQRTLRARAVINTMPAHKLSSISMPVSSDFNQVMQEIPYAPMALVALQYLSTDFTKPLDGFGVLIPREEGLRLLGSIWTSCLFPERAPENRVLLSCFVGGDTDVGVVDTPEEVLLQQVQAELLQLLPLKPESTPCVVEMRMIQQAIPQYTIGHRLRLASIDQWNRSQPSLRFAGNYLTGVSLNDCVTQGIKAADSVVEYLSRQGVLRDDAVHKLRDKALDDLSQAAAL